MRVRVVCGLSDTMASLWPTMRLSSVDLPAFGRARNETKPDLPLILRGDRFPAAQTDLGDAPALHLDHLHVEAVDLKPLADVRHAAKVREQVAADGFEALALDLDAEPILHLVHVHLAAEDERAAALHRKSTR